MKFRQKLAASIIALAFPFVPVSASYSSEITNSQQSQGQASWQQLVQSEPDRVIEGNVRIVKGRTRLSPVSFTANVFEHDNGDLTLRIDYASRSFDIHVENLRPNSMTFARGLGRFEDTVGYYLPAQNTLQFWGPLEDRGGEMVRVTRNFSLDSPLF